MEPITIAVLWLTGATLLFLLALSSLRPSALVASWRAFAGRADGVPPRWFRGRVTLRRVQADGAGARITGAPAKKQYPPENRFAVF